MALVGRLPPSSCLSFILCRCWLPSFFILSFVRSYVFRICFRNSRPPKSCRVALYCSCTSCVCVCLQRQTFLARHVVGEWVLFLGSVREIPAFYFQRMAFRFTFFCLLLSLHSIYFDGSGSGCCSQLLCVRSRGEFFFHLFFFRTEFFFSKFCINCNVKTIQFIQSALHFILFRRK